MQKLVIAVAATAALVLCGSGSWVAQATPFDGSTGRPSQDYSPLEKIGCTKAGDNCPYGQRIVRHTGHGPACEPCSQTQGSKASPPSGPPPGRQPHYDQGYDRGDEGYARGQEGYDRGDQDYDRGDQGYAHGHEGYDRGDQDYDRGDQDYDRGDQGYARGHEGYDNRGYGGEGEQDYGGGPPPGWRSYDEPPYGWQERGCLQFGSLWYCRP
jgi:hypothetical protein